MSNLEHFFYDINCQFQCYNIGRIIGKISDEDFSNFEQCLKPWLFPFLQQAWFAIIFWPSDSSKDISKHQVWFLRFPLDEQAKLNLATRDEFIQQLYHTSQSSPDNLEQVLKNSPYGFQPKEHQLANFHAIISQQFSLDPSQYYHDVQDYFYQNNLENWSKLGLQGIADFCARLSETHHNISNEQYLINHIAHLPTALIQVLGECLENHPISAELSQAMYQQFTQKHSMSLPSQKKSERERNELLIETISIIKSLSQSQSKTIQDQLLSTILQSPITHDIELLATITNKCWQTIQQASLLLLYLEALAHINQQHSFNILLADLMFIPHMRPAILSAFRDPQRSEALANAIGHFLRQNQ